MDSRTQFICRTCLKVINESELYIIGDSETKYGNVIDILETCVSELNVDISDGVVLCYSCTTMLRISYEFKLKCLNTEDKVFHYMKQHNLPIFRKINLVDVITNSNPLENNTVDLSSEEHSHDESVVTGRKETAESEISNRYSLETPDMNFLTEDSNFPGNDDSIIDYGLYKTAKLNRAEYMNKDDYNDDVLMFDDLTNTDVDNCRIIHVREVDPYTNITNNIETLSRNNIHWDMDFERCRFNSSREEYFESLFEISPRNTPEINIENDTIGQFVFKTPLTPTPKRKQYSPNSF